MAHCDAVGVAQHPELDDYSAGCTTDDLERIVRAQDAHSYTFTNTLESPLLGRLVVK